MEYAVVLAAVLLEKPTLSTIWSQKGLYGRLFVTGEVLFIVRPLVYVLLIRKYGIKSWKPWLLSFSMDLTGMCILSHATNPSRGGGEMFSQVSPSEKDEASAYNISSMCLLSIFELNNTRRPGTCDAVIVEVLICTKTYAVPAKGF